VSAESLSRCLLYQISMIFDINLRARDQHRLNFPLVAPLPLAPCFLKLKNGKVGMPIELCILIFVCFYFF